MPLSIPQLALAIISFMVMSVVMFVMKQRKLRAAYPLFFGYIVINAVALVLLLSIFRFAPKQYFYAYWTCSTILMMVGFAVQYEVFVDILKPYSAVIDLGKMLFFLGRGLSVFCGCFDSVGNERHTCQQTGCGR